MAKKQKIETISIKWNRKYIRAIQSVLNITKGIVAPGRSFFEKAFGKDLTESQKVLHMPETLDHQTRVRKR